MKILMIHPHDIFSRNEPWTIRIVSIAKELRLAGHQVRLAYCPLDSRGQAAHPDLDGIETIVLSRKAGLVNLFSNIGKIRKQARWADLVHFQKCFHYISIPAIIGGWLADKPLHYEWDDWEEKIWYHSNRLSAHTLIFGNFIWALERLIPCIADTVSVASGKLKELCLDYGVEEDNIFMAPVGADLNKFNPEVDGRKIREKYNCQKKQIVLYVGQLHGGQYVEMFIQAAARVLERCPRSTFFITGQGYMLALLQEKVRKMGISDQIIFTGSVAHEAVPQYIAAADVCVASFENNDVTVCKSPLKIVEYLASGKPIVASLVGETRNMVGGAGVLVEPGNSRALAEAIIGLLNDPSLKEEIGRRARRRATRRYNWKKTAENLLKAYKVALGGDHAGRAR